MELFSREESKEELKRRQKLDALSKKLESEGKSQVEIETGLEELRSKFQRKDLLGQLGKKKGKSTTSAEVRALHRQIDAERAKEDSSSSDEESSDSSAASDDDDDDESSSSGASSSSASSGRRRSSTKVAQKRGRTDTAKAAPAKRRRVVRSESDDETEGGSAAAESDAEGAEGESDAAGDETDAATRAKDAARAGTEGVIDAYRSAAIPLALLDGQARKADASTEEATVGSMLNPTAIAAVRAYGGLMALAGGGVGAAHDAARTLLTSPPDAAVATAARFTRARLWRWAGGKRGVDAPYPQWALHGGVAGLFVRLAERALSHTEAADPAVFGAAPRPQAAAAAAAQPAAMDQQSLQDALLSGLAPPPAPALTAAAHAAPYGGGAGIRTMVGVLLSISRPRLPDFAGVGPEDEADGAAQEAQGGVPGGLRARERRLRAWRAGAAKSPVVIQVAIGNTVKTFPLSRVVDVPPTERELAIWRRSMAAACGSVPPAAVYLGVEEHVRRLEAAYPVSPADCSVRDAWRAQLDGIVATIRDVGALQQQLSALTARQAAAGAPSGEDVARVLRLQLDIQALQRRADRAAEAAASGGSSVSALTELLSSLTEKNRANNKERLLVAQRSAAAAREVVADAAAVDVVVGGDHRGAYDALWE